MRKIITAALMSLGLFAGLFAVTPAVASNYECVVRNDRASHTFKDSKMDVYVQANVIYRYCKSPIAPNFVKPLRSINSYYTNEGTMNCAPLMRYLDGVTFNYYSWEPHSGRNYNPPGVTALCDPSGSNSVTQSWRKKSKRLYYGKDWHEHPRWKVNVTLKRNFNFDKDWQHAQNFRPAT